MSLPSPAFLVNRDGSIDNMNMMAASYFNPESGAGEYYYQHSGLSSDRNDGAASKEAGAKGSINQVLPWLKTELAQFMAGEPVADKLIKNVEIYRKQYNFLVRLSELYDVSKKFNGVVIILEDITRLKQVEEEIRELAGFVPICSHCKNIRDDKGYWKKLEEFIEQRSGALFSHSICDDCLEKLYPEDEDEDVDSQ